MRQTLKCKMSQIGNISKQENYATTFINDNLVLQISTYVLFTALCQLICIFGVVTNSINIVCFVKQGIKDPINVSFIGIPQLSHKKTFNFFKLFKIYTIYFVMHFTLLQADARKTVTRYLAGCGHRDR